ncbi:MAG: hypothetical protein K2J73_01070 [Oscillospiraceae bacterium]|nr:hypothetical protein [Oscillospiraceae bacterium]
MGNVIFPDDNALKYLKEYFDPNKTYENPYAEDHGEYGRCAFLPTEVFQAGI